MTMQHKHTSEGGRSMKAGICLNCKAGNPHTPNTCAALKHTADRSSRYCESRDMYCAKYDKCKGECNHPRV